MGEVSFVEDIQEMLWGLGGPSLGNLSTAQLVEKVLIQQLRWLWDKVTAIAENHGASNITIEHFLFVVRKSPPCITRILRYYNNKSFVNMPLIHTENTFYKRCVNYLTNLDPDFVPDDEQFAAEYLSRLSRLDKTASLSDSARYKDFCRARCVSFGHGRSSGQINKFSDFLGRIDALDLRTPETTDLMAFFAFEMVGELVDLVYRLRTDFDAKPITPAEIREVVRRLQGPFSLPGALFLRADSALPFIWG